ncbi:MAG: hypothetical protein NTV16_09685 [Actinobacteria bacterium]|nr:hypothetical protein [Actinomycetota bacterium]
MIVLSENILEKRFESGLKRGIVLRTIIDFSTKQKFKRLLLLNIDFKDKEILFIFTTSSVDWYKQNINSPIVKENCIFFDKGETTNNITENMVIDCRKVYSIAKSDLFNNFKNSKLDFLDEFNEKIILRIDNIIKNSKLIELKYLRKIIR